MAQEGRRVAYDKLWGGLLLLGCLMPYRLDGESQAWQLFARGTPTVKAWLALSTLAGLGGVILGFSGWRKRRRHLVNFLLGVAALVLPLFLPAIWQTFPHANPRELPLGDPGSVGWVLLVSQLALYAGSGIRIVRPAQIAGQALGALGALLLAVFACLPMEGSESSFAWSRFQLALEPAAHWRQLVPFALGAAAAVMGMINLLRSRAEVWLARLTRLLLVGALVFWLGVPFLEKGGDLKSHLPYAWGGIHLLGPLFLALDGAVAFLAISITRSNE